MTILSNKLLTNIIKLLPKWFSAIWYVYTGVRVFVCDAYLVTVRLYVRGDAGACAYCYGQIEGTLIPTEVTTFCAEVKRSKLTGSTGCSFHEIFFYSPSSHLECHLSSSHFHSLPSVGWRELVRQATHCSSRVHDSDKFRPRSKIALIHFSHRMQ